jgi:potassium/hydrogen antiporter
MSAEQLDVVLAVGTAVLLVAVGAVRLSSRAGLPSLLFYLGLGLALGESGLGIRFDDYELTQTIGLVALALILAEGGLTTQWRVIRPVLGLSVALATVGVAASVAVTAAATHVLLGWDWRTSVLLGAVVSSTDAAAVFSVLRRLPLRGRLAATLEAESGFNDPPVVLLVMLVSSDEWGHANPLVVLGEISLELAVGAVVGLAVGKAGQWLQLRSALPAVGLYPLATLGIALLAYSVAGLLHGSGFLAVYLAALLLGNTRLPHRRATVGFAEAVAWLAQIGLFVLLGLLASPPRLVHVIGPALVAGTVLLLVARPLAVLLAATPFRVPWRVQLFLSWAGLRGAVPIVLATIPLTARVPNAELVFDVVFVLVVVFTAIQAPTLPWVARRLGVTESAASRELTVDTAVLDELHSDLLQLTIPPGSHLAGVHLHELRLPPEAVVTLVVRDGSPLVPDDQTWLTIGDHLLVVVPAEARAATERRLRAVSRAGKLAHWQGEQGAEDPCPPPPAPPSTWPPPRRLGGRPPGPPR